MIAAQSAFHFEASDVEKKTKSADLTNTTSSEIRVLTDIEGITGGDTEKDPQVENVEHFQSITRYVWRAEYLCSMIFIEIKIL